jgi:hypothetical protein
MDVEFLRVDLSYTIWIDVKVINSSFKGAVLTGAMFDEKTYLQYKSLLEEGIDSEKTRVLSEDELAQEKMNIYEGLE